MPPSEALWQSDRPISPQEACKFALQRLTERGISEIVICEIRWIAAPLAGYLIDAQGMLGLNGLTHTTFRVGIRDGTDEAEGRHTAGDEFVFIARAEDSAGNALWHPSPGPDWQPSPEDTYDDLLPYEFLLEREQFESLENRYR
jgi:hypothetical protein